MIRFLAVIAAAIATWWRRIRGQGKVAGQPAREIKPEPGVKLSRLYGRRMVKVQVDRLGNWVNPERQRRKTICLALAITMKRYRKLEKRARHE